MSGRKEYPDPTPVEMPLGFKRPPTLQEEIQRIIRVQMSQQARAEGFETFEEADDFAVDEDPDPLSAYEVMEMEAEGPTKGETISGPVSSSSPGPGAVPASLAMGEESPPVVRPGGVVEPPAAVSKS